MRTGKGAKLLVLRTLLKSAYRLFLIVTLIGSCTTVDDDVGAGADDKDVQDGGVIDDCEMIVPGEIRIHMIEI